MRKLFVSGATGVLGRRVVPALVAAGNEVYAVARTDEKAARLTTAGATPITVDLFDADAVAGAIAGCDAVLHLATNIPLGSAALRKRTWRTNDRLRTEAAANLSRAAIDAGVERYVGESITFPYVDRGADWIGEDTERTYDDSMRSTLNAERAALAVTESGGAGVVLRFAMFHAADSGHLSTFLTAAKRGFSPFFGPDDNYLSFIDTGDAAQAVVAALDVAPGVYNVAEPNPVTRGSHVATLAQLMGKKHLRATPKLIQRAGGDAVETLSRSQRISSQTLQNASKWSPRVDTVNRWKDLT